jgi:hypothetical protein
MKTILKVIFSISILISGYSFSQTWPKYYSKPNNDSYSDDIIEMYDKGYLICGNYNGYYGSNFKQWSWLIKTDINGNILWEKIIEGGDEFIRTVAIEPTQDGGMLTCGLIWSALDNYDPYVMEINACGEKEWCKIFTGSINESSWAQDIIKTDDGSVFILVNQYGNPQYETIHLIKLNSEGEKLWIKPYCSGYIHPEALHPMGESLSIISNNELIISGSVYWAPQFPKPITPLFIMVDSAGIENWVLPFGYNDTILGDAYNTFLTTGDTLIGTGSYWTLDNVHSIFFKFDKNGNELDYKIVISNEIDTNFVQSYFPDYFKINNNIFWGGNVEIQNISNYFPIVDIKCDSDLFINGFNIEMVKVFETFYDPFTHILTSDFKLLSNSTFKEPGNWDITLSKLNLNLEFDTIDPGNYIYDSLCQPGPPQSGFIFLDDCDIITGTEIPSPEEYYSFIATIPITAFPNPAETEITLAFQNTKHHTNMVLECYNIYGRQVHTEKIWKGQQETKIDLRGWAKGLYFAVVKSEGTLAGSVRFIRQ